MRLDTEILKAVEAECRRLHITIEEKGFTGKAHHKWRLRNRHGATVLLTLSASCSDAFFAKRRALGTVNRLAKVRPRAEGPPRRRQ